MKYLPFRVQQYNLYSIENKFYVNVQSCKQLSYYLVEKNLKKQSKADKKIKTEVKLTQTSAHRLQKDIYYRFRNQFLNTFLKTSLSRVEIKPHVRITLTLSLLDVAVQYYKREDLNSHSVFLLLDVIAACLVRTGKLYLLGKLTGKFHLATGYNALFLSLSLSGTQHYR